MCITDLWLRFEWSSLTRFGYFQRILILRCDRYKIEYLFAKINFILNEKLMLKIMKNTNNCEWIMKVLWLSVLLQESHMKNIYGLCVSLYIKFGQKSLSSQEWLNFVKRQGLREDQVHHMRGAAVRVGWAWVFP